MLASLKESDYNKIDENEEDDDYSDKLLVFKDLDGHLWQISKYIIDETEELDDMIADNIEQQLNCFMPPSSTKEIDRKSPLQTKEQLNSTEEQKTNTIEAAANMNPNDAKEFVKQWLDKN